MLPLLLGGALPLAINSLADGLIQDVTDKVSKD
jgi:hypothetical protein